MRFVLDSSALLCLLFDEPGRERVADLLGDGMIGAVNLSEVVARLRDRGLSPEQANDALAQLKLHCIAFDEAMAVEAGLLRATTRRAGLSMGDRACLALAKRLDATAVTADRAWGSLDLGLSIEVIR